MEEKKSPNGGLPFFQRAWNRLKRLPWKKIGIGTGIAAAVILLLLIGTVCRLIASAPSIDSIDVSPSGSATWICDADGNYVRKLSLSDSNREIVSLDEVPQILSDAVVSIEDSRFYEHSGIDLHGIARAFFNGISRGSFSEGASIITQQLIKNSVFTEWTQETSFADRLSRKIQEQYLALQLEKQLSKEEILEDYLNTINFGSGCYGVQAASRRYFGKNVSELTLSEAAVLAAIPQNPSGYSPIEFPEANRQRQRLILRYMEEQGYISHEERMEALEDDVYSRIRSYNESYEGASVYTYYEDALIDQAASVLMSELNYSSEQAYRALYSGGLRIYSAQDPALQQICDEEFQNPANFPEGTQYGIDYAVTIQEADGSVSNYGSDALRSYIRKTTNPSFDLLCTTQEEAQACADAFRESLLQAEAETESVSSEGSEDSGSASPSERTVLAERLTLSPEPQASLVLIDQSTGFVRAVVGGRGEKTASLTLNRATDTTRQPGSTFKILTAYAPALDARGQTLATLYENEPFSYEDGTAVSNWDITDYSGDVTIREAIARSINVVAVRCITEITPRLGFAYAERFGISTLIDDWESADGSSDVIQPLALGGVTNGVTNLELCAAYASIANGGMYGTPLFFTKILDQDGNILLDFSERTAAASEKAAKAENTSDVTGRVDASPSPGSFTRVLQESSAFLLTSAMQDVVSSEEGTAYGSIQASGQPVAGKTGTTSSYKDIWFVGYTPYYTCSVWGGYDNNQSLPDGGSWHSYSKSLWSAVMNRIHAGLTPAEFPQPETVRTVVLCSDSHLPVREGACPEPYTEYFADGTEPTELCTLHELQPETEKPLIYPDVLEQLFPEKQTEQDSETGSEPASEDETEADSESDSENETEADSVTDSENEAEADSVADSENEAEADSAADSENKTETDSGSDSENETEANSALAPDEETNSLEDLMNRLGGSGFALP